MRVRVALSFFIALAAQPMLPAMPAMPLDTPAAFATIAQQVVIGLTLGFAVRLVFAAVEFAGELVGLQMGLNFAGFFDPVTASQATATSRCGPISRRCRDGSAMSASGWTRSSSAWFPA